MSCCFLGSPSLTPNFSKAASVWFLLCTRAFISISLTSYLQINTDRAVVGAEEVWMNFGGLHLGLQACRNKHIVDAPADISGTGIAEMAPPGVVAVSLLEHAKRIDEAGVD